MSAVQTTFAGRSPFAKKPDRKAHIPVNLSGVEKCRDPYLPERVIKRAKYEEMFAGVKEGDCFRVSGGSAELTAVARALRVYLKKHGINGLVRQNARTKDGIGRVWLVKILKGGAA